MSSDVIRRSIVEGNLKGFGEVLDGRENSPRRFPS